MITNTQTCLEAILIFNATNFANFDFKGNKLAEPVYQGGYAYDLISNNDNDTVENYFKWLADNGYKFEYETEAFWPNIEENQLYIDNEAKILRLTAEFEFAYRSANFDHLCYLLENKLLGENVRN